MRLKKPETAAASWLPWLIWVGCYAVQDERTRELRVFVNYFEG